MKKYILLVHISIFFSCYIPFFYTRIIEVFVIIDFGTWKRIAVVDNDLWVFVNCELVLHEIPRVPLLHFFTMHRYIYKI